MKASRSTDGISDATGLLGLQEMASALDRWASQPGKPAFDELVDAFSRLVSVAGMDGGDVHLDAPPLVEVELKSGLER